MELKDQMLRKIAVCIELPSGVFPDTEEMIIRRARQ